MEKNYKKNKNQKGFTLLEISISVIILGMMLATAAPLYKQYKTNQKTKQTDLALSQASNAVGGFKSTYGRYPCPAPANALPGSANYGYEDCTATAPGVRTAVSTRTPALSNPNIVIGTLPFRSLNLQEKQIYDGFKNRLTYAVTQSQTVDTTYDSALGGISILDRNNDTMVTPADSGHFVIISHGENDEGAFGYSGVRKGTCTNALVKDNENCDDDSAFRVSQIESDFDDKAVYSSAIDVSPWQYGNTAGNQNDIFLRRGDRVILGDPSALTNPLLSSAETLEVKDRGLGTPDDGAIKAEVIIDTAGAPQPDLSGAFVAQTLCDLDTSTPTFSATDCFQPQIIGGELAPGPYTSMGPASVASTNLGTSTSTGGMVCAGNEVMIGIENGLPVCSDVIEFNCPPGEYMAGFNASGAPKCSTAPPSACPATNVVTTCGETKTLAGTTSGNKSTVYSGQCYMLNTFDPVMAQNIVNTASPATPAQQQADLQAYINTLNAAARTQMDCTNSKGAPDPLNNLVRDSYLCTNGTFDTSNSDRAQERLSYGTSWPGSLITNWPGGRHAETWGLSYSITNDPNNVGGAHDCWCREDYRLITVPCGLGTSGTNTFEVQKHRCPQTDDHQWVSIWQAVGPGLCSCLPGTTSYPELCHIHFGTPSNSVSGTATITANVNCGSGVPILSSMTADTSGCTCPANTSPRIVSTTACPSGDINGPFTAFGSSFTNTQTVTAQTWNCPTGVGGNVANASQVGQYVPTIPPYLVHNEPCLCDSSATGTSLDPCPPGQMGPGTVWQTQKTCPSGTFVRTGVILSGPNCTICTWETPARGYDNTAFGGPTGPNPGTTCSCGTTGTVRQPIGGGQVGEWYNANCN